MLPKTTLADALLTASVTEARQSISSCVF